MPELRPNISVIHTNLTGKRTFTTKMQTLKVEKPQNVLYKTANKKNNLEKHKVKREVKVYRQVQTVLKQVLWY